MGLEEELGHGEVGQGQLGRQVVAVARQVGRERVAGGLGGHPDGEPADGPGQLHQLRGVGQLADGGVGVGRRVAAQGHQVLDARPAQLDQDLGQLEAGVGDADQVGHRHQVGRPQHAGDQIDGPPPRLRPAPVGDRHERRAERLELAQGGDQRGLLGVVLRREELERVGLALVEQVGDAGHGPPSLLPGTRSDQGPSPARTGGVSAGRRSATWACRRASAPCSSASGPAGPGRPGPAARRWGPPAPWRSSRSASMAKASPRSAPAAVVAEPPAAGSGAVDAGAARARSPPAPPGRPPRPAARRRRTTAEGDSSASRASRASLRAGSARRRQASMADFRFRRHQQQDHHDDGEHQDHHQRR